MQSCHMYLVSVKVGHTLGDMLRGHEADGAGTCCGDSFPHVSCPFLRKSSVAGTKVCPCHMLHEIQLVWFRTPWSRDNLTSIFNVALCALLLQTVLASTHFYASIRFVYTSLSTIPATCILCVHTKGLVPATCPLVCTNLLISCTKLLSRQIHCRFL